MPETAQAMTWSSLMQDLKDYLERGDLRDPTVLRQLPRIINNTERQLADMLKLQGYLKNFVSWTGIGAPACVIAKPQNWRTTASINVGTGPNKNVRKTLRLRSYDTLRVYFPNSAVVGTPEFYADYNETHWIIGPSPDAAYPFEANIYVLPPLLDETNQENYLTKYTPFLILYQCLLACEPFLRNDARMATWKDRRDEALNAALGQDIQKIADRSIERDHP